MVINQDDGLLALPGLVNTHDHLRSLLPADDRARLRRPATVQEER